MKYWGYLAAKLLVALAILSAMQRSSPRQFPPMRAFYLGGPNPVMRNLNYTFVMLAFGLFAAGLVWLILRDQRYRCRTCLRRCGCRSRPGPGTTCCLGAPRTEYICPYGHGTLKVAELQITGHQQPDWRPHDDMWKELFSLEETKR